MHETIFQIINSYSKMQYPEEDKSVEDAILCFWCLSETIRKWDRKII